MRKYFVFILGGVVVAGLLLFFAGLFPVASVNGEFLWSREFSAYGDAFNRFRANIERASSPDAPSLGFEGVAEEDITMSLLEELIVRKIVFKEGSKSFADFNKNAEGIMTEALGGQGTQLEEAARTLYGLDLEEFKKLILLPEAREIALKRLIEESGQNYKEWFLERLEAADVKIYFYDYRWEDGKLVSK